MRTRVLLPVAVGVLAVMAVAGTGVGATAALNGVTRDVQLNGEVRVVAETAFEDVEGGLLADGTLIEQPYVIDVVGEPGVLAGAVEFALGPRAQIEGDGASLEVTELGSIDVEAVREPQEAEYAVPDPDQ